MTSEQQAYKSRLLRKIQQQRLDLLHCERQWQAAMSPIDESWEKLVRFKWWFLAGGSALTLWQLRRPGRLIQLARRGIGLWSTWQFIRRSLR